MDYRTTMDLLQLLFFAGLAVFLGVRLYMTLGKQTGRTPEEHAREMREQAARREAGRPAERAQSAPAEAGPEAIARHYAGPAGSGLAEIAEADRNFDPQTFLTGAKQAWRMVVEAYAKGDRDTLKGLLSPRVLEAYSKAIAEREDKGHTQITEIERLREAEIVEASLNDNRARIRVRFVAELATETRDAAGERVSGDLALLKTVSEVWSFERDVTSSDPNWTLAGVKPV
ncbi:Tim44 domain-containing protein [Marinicauda algicola]|uniref:Tim44 domain-containing protein n=1 Tax=Marinicauda algicola TaxID=2029849 RepID=A0A4S2H0H3_9PROT|nr:Tim44/TimA family putative adaptor protein [Marinicauda algicola]TGY89027.1 Tim44 domain-containing protein [Marinicauda algicola]